MPDKETRKDELGSHTCCLGGSMCKQARLHRRPRMRTDSCPEILGRNVRPALATGTVKRLEGSRNILVEYGRYVRTLAGYCKPSSRMGADTARVSVGAGTSVYECWCVRMCVVLHVCECARAYVSISTSA